MSFQQLQRRVATSATTKKIASRVYNVQQAFGQRLYNAMVVVSPALNYLHDKMIERDMRGIRPADAVADPQDVLKFAQGILRSSPEMPDDRREWLSNYYLEACKQVGMTPGQAMGMYTVGTVHDMYQNLADFIQHGPTLQPQQEAPAVLPEGLSMGNMF